MSQPGSQETQRFGTVLGYAPGGVAIYSSHYPSADKREYPDRNSYRSSIDGVYLGYKWQCVEFARRWLYLNYGYVFDDVPMAYDIFSLHHVRRVADDATLPLHSFRNGSVRPPEPGCMLIWAEGGEFEVTGHVAIVTEFTPEYVRFAEQNLHHSLLPEGQAWSRQLPVSRTREGGYRIHPQKGAKILGWVVQTSDNRHAEPRVLPEPRLYQLDSRLAFDNGLDGRDWLDQGDRAEAAFIRAMGGQRLSSASDAAEQRRYFRLSETATGELARATNELHLMFLHATQAVLQDETLLRHFNIPACLWPRLRKSWENRRGQTITGRFDFSVSAEGIKVYEYNADSASCHLEAGRIQGKCAGHLGILEGEDAGAPLTTALVEAWRESGAAGLLHIMHDNEAEETYHAQYIRACAEAAGLRCKVIRGVAGLSWDASGEIVDDEGQPIRFVWKTWAWETALDQIRAECEADDAMPVLRTAEDHYPSPRLVDVLLRPEIMVYEPFWTLIPSNKAILPILWQIFPQHPYLLESQFSITPSLAQQGYVSKPIVGRCGDNISLVDSHDHVLNETGGRFEDRDQIYQALWKLPEIGNYRTQVCTFTARGKYAGACIRVDTGLIITTASDILPLRVVNDEVIELGGAG